jgi:hypothetical protein
MVCKDDAGSSKRKVIRRNFWSQVVGSKPIPNENDDSPCSWACVLLLRSEASCQSEQHEGESTQENKRPYFHGLLLGNDASNEGCLIQTRTIRRLDTVRETIDLTRVTASYARACVCVKYIIVLFFMRFGDKHYGPEAPADLR